MGKWWIDADPSGLVWTGLEKKEKKQRNFYSTNSKKFCARISSRRILRISLRLGLDCDDDLALIGARALEVPLFFTKIRAVKNIHFFGIDVYL